MEKRAQSRLRSHNISSSRSYSRVQDKGFPGRPKTKRQLKGSPRARQVIPDGQIGLVSSRIESKDTVKERDSTVTNLTSYELTAEQKDLLS